MMVAFVAHIYETGPEIDKLLANIPEPRNNYCLPGHFKSHTTFRFNTSYTTNYEKGKCCAEAEAYIRSCSLVSVSSHVYIPSVGWFKYHANRINIGL